MKISKEDRAFLLDSDKPSVQIQRILKQYPGMTMTLSELRGFYQDLSEGRFRSTVYSMRANGIVRLEDDLITLVRETKAGGDTAAKVWKAMKIKGSFTLCELVDILPGILPSSIKKFITLWEHMGALTRNVATGGENCIWSVDPRRKKRPVQKRADPEKKQDDSLTGMMVRKVVEVIDSYGSALFTPSQLRKDLGDEMSDSRFVQHLLSSWQKMGLIKLKSYDGEEYVFKVNRTLVNKIGWGGGKWKKEES